MRKLYRRLVRHLREIWHRVKAPTPAFWRKAQKRSAAAVVTLTTLWTQLTEGTQTKHWVGVAIIFLTAVAAVAQLTCDDQVDAQPPTTN